MNIFTVQGLLNPPKSIDSSKGSTEKARTTPTYTENMWEQGV